MTQYFNSLMHLFSFLLVLTLANTMNAAQEDEEILVRIHSAEGVQDTFTVVGKLFDQKAVLIEAVDDQLSRSPKRILESSDTILNGFVMYCRLLKSNKFPIALATMMLPNDPHASQTLLSFYKNPEYIKNVVEQASGIEHVEPILAVANGSGLVRLFARVKAKDYKVINVVALRKNGDAWMVVPSALSDERDKIESRIFESLAKDTEDKGKTIEFEISPSEE